jgi:carbamoyltransferase
LLATKVDTISNFEHFLGISKTLFNSSTCLITANRQKLEAIEILLSERHNRVKADGSWPKEQLLKLSQELSSNAQIAENRDFTHPKLWESILDENINFYDYLKKKGLFKFCSLEENELTYITHHLCHAEAAKMTSPFEKALIFVQDGAGTEFQDFEDGPEKKLLKLDSQNKTYECYSLYELDNGKLICLEKEMQTFISSNKVLGSFFSNGLGAFYEKIAEYIFNSKRASGKVMGLAGFGSNLLTIDSPRKFLENLDWNKKFNKTNKSDWESSKDLQFYKDLAFSVQSYFEKNLIERVRSIKSTYPNHDRLILTGGSALNCSANMKLLNERIFSEIYVPPSPGDESIGLGLSAHLYFKKYPESWKPVPHSLQHGYWGSKDSMPDSNKVQSIFSKYRITKPTDIINFTAEKLVSLNIIAWFQGRSESGPRALGNRSILASIQFPNLKDYLNDHIKFRESFRPYGCSVPQEETVEYFKVTKDFNNPFMSFAVPIQEKYLEQLKEVAHIDGTSRMQTVSLDQNKRFYHLLKKVGDLSNLPILLNTSLNIMGEPIVETIEDAELFFRQSKVDALVLGDFYIEK